SVESVIPPGKAAGHQAGERDAGQEWPALADAEHQAPARPQAQDERAAFADVARSQALGADVVAFVPRPGPVRGDVHPGWDRQGRQQRQPAYGQIPAELSPAGARAWFDGVRYEPTRDAADCAREPVSPTPGRRRQWLAL